jgi:hypothetical protein
MESQTYLSYNSHDQMNHGRRYRRVVVSFEWSQDKTAIQGERGKKVLILYLE